jgi:hypothetical protein
LARIAEYASVSAIFADPSDADMPTIRIRSAARTVMNSIFLPMNRVYSSFISAVSTVSGGIFKTPVDYQVKSDEQVIKLSHLIAWSIIISSE